MNKLDDIFGKHPGLIKGLYKGEPILSPETIILKQNIKKLMLEIIGEDEEPGRTMGPGIPNFQRDKLRREQRQKVEDL